MRYFAIGDIHGRFDMLKALLTELGRRWIKGDRLVFLGDYVDRGPDSKSVVYEIQRLVEEDQAIALKGNHEDMMVAAHGNGDADMWVCNGGATTLRSFGGTVPTDVIEWTDTLPTWFQPSEDFYFVHAGLEPGIPLADQSDISRLWTREPFLSADYDFGPRIVHGHTPNVTIQHKANRTGIDTGAFDSRGFLTCGVFEEGKRDEPTFFQINQSLELVGRGRG